MFVTKHGIKTIYNFSNERDCYRFWRDKVAKNNQLEGRSVNLNRCTAEHIGNSIV